MVVKSLSINEGLSILPMAFCDNWTDPIIAYLEEEKLPEDKFEPRNLRLRATMYVINGKTLYKRGFSMPYLQCILPKEAEYILRNVHEGVYGSHAAERSLA